MPEELVMEFPVVHEVVVPDVQRPIVNEPGVLYGAPLTVLPVNKLDVCVAPITPEVFLSVAVGAGITVGA